MRIRFKVPESWSNLSRREKSLILLILSFILLICKYGNSRFDYEVYLTETRKILQTLGDRKAGSLILRNVETNLIHPEGICTGQNSEAIFLLFIVFSAPGNLERRNAFRRSLKTTLDDYNSHPKDPNLTKIKGKVKLVFFQGVPHPKDVVLMESLKSEAKLHEDMIIDDFQETYQNLTLKTLRMLKWVTGACFKSRQSQKVEYIVKMDDDIYLNFPKFLNTLNSLISKRGSRLLAGRRAVEAIPNRDPSARWFTPIEVYSGEMFPTYATGAFYIYSAEVALMVYQKSFSVPLFHLEDVYINGLVATEGLGFDIDHIDEYISFWNVLMGLSTSSCSFRELYTAIHLPHNVAPRLLKCWTKLIKEPRCSWIIPVYFSC